MGKRRGFRWSWALLAAGVALGAGTVQAQQITITSEDADQGLLIEDDDEIIVISEGPTLDEILTQEAAQSQEQVPPQETQTSAPVLAPADESRLSSLMGELTAIPNPTGSDGELEMCQQISRQMEQLGYTVTQQAFHEGFLNDSFTDVPGVNLIAERGANSATRNDGILVLCCHYDAKTEPAPEDPLPNDKTGAAVLLEVARILRDVPSDMDLCFLFLSGEEDGGYGSERFAETFTPDQIQRIRGVLYVGTVGIDLEAPCLLGTQDGAPNLLSERVAAAGAVAYGSAAPAPGVTEGVIQEESGPEDWSVAVHLGTGAVHFASLGLETVYLFQDVTGIVKTPTAPDETGATGPSAPVAPGETATEAQPQAPSAPVAPNETATEAQAPGAATVPDETEAQSQAPSAPVVPDETATEAQVWSVSPTALAGMADTVARAAVQYLTGGSDAAAAGDLVAVG